MALHTKWKSALMLNLLLCSHAIAQDVYPGCEAPVAVAGHHTFFVDPVKGNDTGDGSATRPWKNLNTVLAPANKLLATKSHKTLTGSPLLEVNPTAPIKGGDTIMLMSGNYGDVSLANVFNDKFITIMPAPGAKPVIAHLNLGGAARWMFQNLTFQSEYPSGSAMNAYSLATVTDGWGDTTKNIIFNSNTFQTTDNASAWTDKDWFSKPNYGALSIRSGCVAVTNSTMRNLMNGIIVTASQTLIKNNTIDRFSIDGIDVYGGQAAIVGNTITNGMSNSTTTTHPDAIQVGSPVVGGKVPTNVSDLLIDSNKISTPGGKEGNTMMGISATNYNNVTLQNNVVVVNHWNSITLRNLHNARILNNTAMSSDPTTHPSYISVYPNDNGSSTNVVIRNNVSSYINLLDQSITADHNAASQAYNLLQGGKTVWRTQSDTASQNLVLPTLETAFRDWNPSQNDFDLHLKAASALAGKGSQTLAPSVDADGRSRVAPIDLGAFSRPSASITSNDVLN